MSPTQTQELIGTIDVYGAQCIRKTLYCRNFYDFVARIWNISYCITKEIHYFVGILTNVCLMKRGSIVINTSKPQYFIVNFCITFMTTTKNIQNESLFSVQIYPCKNRFIFSESKLLFSTKKFKTKIDVNIKSVWCKHLMWHVWDV